MSRYAYTKQEEEWDEHEYFLIQPQKDDPKVTSQKSPALSSSPFGGSSYFGKINNGEVIMFKGHKGWHVGYLQKALQKLGYDIGTDKAEVFGEGTENALKAFQKNAGFIGGEVDGVLGKGTLRILDFDYSLTEPKIEQEGTHLVFKVPVNEDMKGMTHDEYEIVVAMWIFDITEGEAETLMQKYHIKGWQPLTDIDIARGYKRLSISQEIYYQYIAKRGEGGSDYSASFEELKERFFGMEEAYKLYQQGGDSPQLLKLLKENGFNSVEEFEEEKDRFLRLFQREAVRTVYDLLDKSYLQINIEEKHYENDAGVADFKNNVIDKLKPIYDQADVMMIDALNAYEIFQKEIAVGATERDKDKIKRFIRQY